MSRADGSVLRWGAGAKDARGFPNFGQAAPPRGAFVHVAAGDAHSCGMSAEGWVSCWGSDGSGRASPTVGASRCPTRSTPASTNAGERAARTSRSFRVRRAVVRLGAAMTQRITACALLLSLLPALSGCTSAYVNRGTVIGALSGAAAGAGVGFLISDPDLLGSKSGEGRGDIALDSGESILAGAAIGLVFGAIVGAMAGHGRDDGLEPPPPMQELPPPPVVEPDGESTSAPAAALRPVRAAL